jgi:hypothetical protein
VAATNAAGTSPAASTNAVTPAGVPGTVHGVSATAGDRSATVTWAAADGNGAPVIGYVITAFPSGRQATTGPEATSVVVQWLTNGVPQTFAVVAVNDVGPSAASAATDAVTPAGAPLAPPGVKVTRGDKKLSVTWSAANGNGSPVTGYTVTYGSHTLTLPATARSATLTGLTNGTTYRVSVTATNALGTGTPSATVSAVPAGRPGIVTKPTVKVSGRTITITWKAPATNGARISAYVLTGGKPATKVVGGSIRKYVYRDMRPGTYRLRVAARNAAGTGPASTAVAARVR